MQDYLKKHATQAAYTTWAASNDYVTPNVSLIEATGDLEYNPPVLTIALQSITINNTTDEYIYWNGNNDTKTITATLIPANTTETGITWSLSGVENGVSIQSQDGTSCTLHQQYNGPDFQLIATSTSNPAISTSVNIRIN